MKVSFKKSLFISCLMCTLFCITGCDSNKNQRPFETESETDSQVFDENNLDIYVVISIDEDNKRLIVEDIKNEKKIALEYTGGTRIQNKFGDEITISRIRVGEVVEIQYDTGTQKIVKIKISDQVWEYTGLKNFSIDSEKGILSVSGKNYSFSEDFSMAFSGGLEISFQEINEVDELTIKGYGAKIITAIVDVGHGFVVLENEESYVGGYIEIGDKIIREITQDMVITAPEGTHILTMSKSGMGGSQTIVVLRGEELTVDISRLQEAQEMGSVKFNIVPESAKLFVDGSFMKHTDPVSLSFGNHSFRITASGYKTQIGRINVNSSYTSKTFILNPQETTSQETTASVQDKKIKINSPEGASVYFDGVLVGTVPASITKEYGTHTITLRKTGYDSVSYTVKIPDDGKDTILDFDELTLSQ